MRVLFYSNKCQHCLKLVTLMKNMDIVQHFNFICIDNNKNIPNLNELELKTKLRTLNKEIEKQTVDVGENFADEARLLYKGEKKGKAIRGTATKKEEKKLKEGKRKRHL